MKREGRQGTPALCPWGGQRSPRSEARRPLREITNVRNKKGMNERPDSGQGQTSTRAPQKPAVPANSAGSTPPHTQDQGHTWQDMPVQMDVSHLSDTQRKHNDQAGSEQPRGQRSTLHKDGSRGVGSRVNGATASAACGLQAVAPRSQPTMQSLRNHSHAYSHHTTLCRVGRAGLRSLNPKPWTQGA